MEHPEAVEYFKAAIAKADPVKSEPIIAEETKLSDRHGQSLTHRIYLRLVSVGVITK